MYTLFLSLIILYLIDHFLIPSDSSRRCFIAEIKIALFFIFLSETKKEPKIGFSNSLELYCLIFILNFVFHPILSTSKRVPLRQVIANCFCLSRFVNFFLLTIKTIDTPNCRVFPLAMKELIFVPKR